MKSKVIISGIISLLLRKVALCIILLLFSNLHAGSSPKSNSSINDLKNKIKDTVLIYTKNILIVTKIDTQKTKLYSNNLVQFEDNKIMDSPQESYPNNNAKFIVLHADVKDSLNIIQNNGNVISVNDIVSHQEKIEHSHIKRILYITAILLIISSCLIWFYFKKNNKKFQRHYDNFLESLKISDQEKHFIESEINSTNDDHEEEYSEYKQKTIIITDDTVKHVLSRLAKFEKSHKYIRQDTSLSSLASYLDTNTKYLTEILKQHKGKKFTDYINGLRINYITDILYKNPKYREYKISYLAEESGFASREVFAVVFKKETGISPSYFINNLKKNNTDQEEPPASNMFALQ